MDAEYIKISNLSCNSLVKSSMMNWVYQGNLKLLYFFLQEDFERTKRKQADKKTKRQHFYKHKKRLRGGELLVCVFGFVLLFMYAKSCKKIKKSEIALIPSIHHTTDVYPPQPTYWQTFYALIFICNHL